MSGHGHSNQPSDPLRKLMIIIVLVAAMVGLYQLADPSGPIDPTGMLAFGFVVLAAFTVGELAEVVALPHITGYLIAGLLLGPSMAGVLPDAWRVAPFDHGILNHDVQDQLALLKVLALGLIALTAGGELKLESLRKGLAQIGGVLTGQTIAILTICTAFFWSISQVGFVAHADLAGLDSTSALALGATLAAISLATSPAATIAVLNGMGAKGPMTNVVMSSVVLKDVVVVVLFAVFSALAGQALDIALFEGTLVNYLFFHIVVSLLVGVLLAGILVLYLRYVAHEVLLFLVGLIYVGSYAANHAVPGVHLDPMLMFLMAGFVTANFSTQGDALVESVEQLSLPVYVVFFTLAGAHLELEGVIEMAPYALALVGIRAFALFVGVRFGALVSAADANTVRYGWMGFVSQAGVAIVLIESIGKTLGGDLGKTLATLMIAGVAIHEFVGPVLLKLAVGFAGEGGQSAHAEHAEHPEEVTETTELTEEVEAKLAPWETPEDVEDPWGDPPDVQSAELRKHAQDLEGELQGLVRDLLFGPLEQYKTGGASYLRNLRREFLRHHRRAVLAAQKASKREEIPALLRHELGELARRWRGIVLDRAARKTERSWSALSLVDALDRITDIVPETVEAPWEDRSFVTATDESPVMSVQRGLLRLRKRVAGVGGGLGPRVVPLRDVVRFHFAGHVTTRIEAIAALLVIADGHLAARTRSLFEGADAGFDAVIARVRNADPDTEVDYEALLFAVRAEVDEEFQLAHEELDRVSRDGATRAARILGDGLKRVKDDLPIAGTPDLPAWARRYSMVYGERTTAEAHLQTGEAAARQSGAARFTVLALELELTGLEGRVRDTVNQHRADLARLVRGRGPTQLTRVERALADVLEHLDAALRSDLDGTAMAAKVRADAEPLAKVVTEATREAHRLRDDLADEASIGGLVDALLAASEQLTERYEVPLESGRSGEWRLPKALPTVEVDFRDVVVAYMETTVTRNLTQLNNDLATRVTALVTLLEELDRIVAFNAELAGAELDVLRGEAVPEDTRALVREMVIGALTRTRTRLEGVRDELASLPDEASEGVRTAVLDGLDDLRAQIVDGRVSELRSRIREARTGNLAREAQQLRGRLGAAQERAWSMARSALGEERMARGRRVLGLPEPASAEVSPATFAVPAPRVELPVVYRRLFSDSALEAGDLLTGRAAEIERGRAALSGAHGGRFRAVAVVGPHGVGKGAVVHALVRGSSQRSHISLRFAAPATVAEVDRFFDDLGDKQLVDVKGVRWLFRMEPGGFAPLHRFVERVIADEGRNSWVLSCTTTVWDNACSASSLGDAFPDVVEVAPQAADELASAVLARHSMSGYGLHFEEQDDLGWQVDNFLAREEDVEKRRERAWFRSLHAATGGVVSDALVLWMASIDKVDESEGVVRIGPVPRPPMEALRKLPRDTLLTLRQTSRQGWIDADLYARLFRTRRADAAAHLSRLSHMGLLVKYDEVWRIPSHLRGPIHSVLRERGWL